MGCLLLFIYYIAFIFVGMLVLMTWGLGEFSSWVISTIAFIAVILSNDARFN